jgi:hypothetical protein
MWRFKLNKLFLVLLFVNCSCKKELNSETIPTTGDYFPLTTRSYWNYGPYGIHCENTGLNKVVAGKNYSVVEYRGSVNTTSGNCGIFDSCLFRKENGKYYQALSTDLLPFPLDIKGYYEFIFMEDNAPVGTVWDKTTATGTFTFNNGKVTMYESYTGKIESYFPSFELPNSSTGRIDKYTDVVKVSMKISESAFDSTNKEVLRSEEIYDKWYARNIGLIKVLHRSSAFDMALINYKIL